MMQKWLDFAHILQKHNKSTWLTWEIAGISGVFVLLVTLATVLPGATFLDRLRWLASSICAQLPTHSFYPGSERLPLCARNTGIYLGFLVCLTTLYGLGRGRTQRLPSWSIVITLGCGVASLVVDGLNSLALDLGLPHLYQPNNLLRLATGLLTGLALAVLVLPMLNRMFWREYDRRQSVSSWSMLMLFVPLLIVCFLAVSSQSVYGLYPIAVLSVAGVLTALGSFNLILLVAMSRRDETLSQYRELLVFFGISVFMALGEMLLLAQLKLWLLQTLM